MPPRWMTLMIVGLWLAATSWMVYRDVWPRLRPGHPPPFNIDLTEEVGGGRVEWEIFNKGERIGSADTKVRRLPDRTFDLVSIFRFDGVTLLDLIRLRKVESSYHVTHAGELIALSARVYWSPAGELKGLPQMEDYIGLEGKVEDGMFVPRLDVPAQPDLAENPLFKPSPVPVSREGTVLNPMHPLNKLAGLYEGQSWRIPLVDPLPLVGLAAFKGMASGSTVRYLNAEVSAADLEWVERVAGKYETTIVPCWRIEYSEPGKRPSARTWVRREDGLVLQQEANHEGLDLTLKRDLKKNRAL